MTGGADHPPCLIPLPPVSDWDAPLLPAGTKKMEYKTRQWHEKCFSCCVCQGPIGTKSFIPREQEIYCTGCYEEKFATRCIKCDKVSFKRHLRKVPCLGECDGDRLVDKG